MEITNHIIRAISQNLEHGSHAIDSFQVVIDGKKYELDIEYKIEVDGYREDGTGAFIYTYFDLTIVDVYFWDANACLVKFDFDEDKVFESIKNEVCL